MRGPGTTHRMRIFLEGSPGSEGSMQTCTMTAAAAANNAELAAAQNAASLFRAHAAFVASFLFRLGLEPNEIDDAVQEVFLIAHRQGGYQPGPAQPRTWLAAIAIRVAMKAK